METRKLHFSSFSFHSVIFQKLHMAQIFSVLSLYVCFFNLDSSQDNSVQANTIFIPIYNFHSFCKHCHFTRATNIEMSQLVVDLHTTGILAQRPNLNVHKTFRTILLTFDLVCVFIWDYSLSLKICAIFLSL